MGWAYYNEFDAYAAQWLRNLIAAGHLPPGEVDERSLLDVRAEDLKGFTQCHWFAGIGVWPLSLRNAGWSDDRPVWTGSCPCQPFSAAGKQKGFDDERHLWPVWFDLIAQCRPPVVLGEQVASALAWVDLVQTDMEAAGYAIGAGDICAAGFGGAHIRQRLYFVGVADTPDSRWPGPRGSGEAQELGTAERGGTGRLADTLRDGAEHGPGSGLGTQAEVDSRDRSVPGERHGVGVEGALCRLADATGARRDGPLVGAEGQARDEARLRVSGAIGGHGGLADAQCDQCGQVRAQRGGSGSGSGTQGLDERSGDGLCGCGLALSDGGQRGGVADGEGRQRDGSQAGRQQGDGVAAASGDLLGLALPESQRRHWGQGPTAWGEHDRSSAGRDQGVDGLACVGEVGADSEPAHTPLLGRDAADWLFCRDGKWRPVEPGTFPLVDAAPARVGRLRAYGNALDAGTATAFCKAVIGALGDLDDIADVL